MTNKEILGELKQCWEYITDIKDNEYEQLTSEEYDKLSSIRRDLYDIYEGFYKRLEKENREELRIKSLEVEQGEKVYISDDISGDYISEVGKEKDYFSCEYTDNCYYWYKDEKFLNEYDEEE